MSEETEEKKGGKYFTLATEATHDLCNELIRKYHPDLDSASAKIDIVMAFRDPEGEEPAMKVRGHRVYGQAKIMNLKDRVKGMGDAEITLDGDIWETNLSEEVKAALLDHELEHFEVKRDKTVEFIWDDINRPLLKLKDHDREMGWFDSVARRHRGSSIEIMQLRKLFVDEGQTYLPFVKEFGDQEQAAAIEEVTEGAMQVSVDGKDPVPMTKNSLTDAIARRIKK